MSEHWRWSPHDVSLMGWGEARQWVAVRYLTLVLPSPVTLRKEIASGSSPLDPVRQRGCHLDVHLAPEFLHEVVLQLNSPAFALALLGPHSTLGLGSRGPSGILGQYGLLLLAGAQHSEPSLPSSLLSSSLSSSTP